jgi:hypothetical protein
MRAVFRLVQCALVSAVLVFGAVPAIAGSLPQAADPPGPDITSGDTPRSGAVRRFIAAAVEDDLPGAWQYTRNSGANWIEPRWTGFYPVDKALEAGLRRSGANVPAHLTLLTGCQGIPYALEEKSDVGAPTRITITFERACAVAPAGDDGKGGEDIGVALMDDFGAVDSIALTPVRVFLRKTAVVEIDVSVDPNEPAPVLQAFAGEWLVT